MKAKMPEGAVGTSSGVPEYEVTLTVAKKLEKELINRGYHVVMIRTSHDVNMSSAERSVAANKSGADILIRLHAGTMDNSSVYGALSTCMTSQNPYNASLHDKSYNLSKKIVDTVCGTTGTKNRGVQETDSSSDINWCEIPVCVFEMGFLSNPDEDTCCRMTVTRGKSRAGSPEQWMLILRRGISGLMPAGFLFMCMKTRSIWRSPNISSHLKMFMQASLQSILR